MKIGSFCTGLLLLGMAGQAFAAPTACVASAGTNCPARIADAPQDALVSTLSVAVEACPDNTQSVLDVAVNVTHSAVGDLSITLQNPAGETATLLSNLQGGAGACRGSDVQATFSDGEPDAICSMLIASVAGPAAPVTPLAPLAATSPTGTWTLTVIDGANNGDGALNDWSVDVGCIQGPAPTVPVPAPLSWQALAAIAMLLALIAFGALRRRGFAH